MSHRLSDAETAKIVAEYPTKGAYGLAKEMGLVPQSVRNLVRRLRARGIVIRRPPSGGKGRNGITKRTKKSHDPKKK